MTEPTKPVESALQHAPVQRTLAILVFLFCAGAAVSFYQRRSPANPTSSFAKSPAGIAIDVNRADARELALVPEVGPVLAKRIVADRLANGDYQSLDDLQRVPGIGPKTLQHFRGLGVVDAPSSEMRPIDASGAP